MKRSRVQVPLLSAIVVIGALAWLDQHPVRLPMAGPRARPALTLRQEGHPILLLVDAERIRDSRPTRLVERWPDLEWDNLLTQGFGGCDVADLADLGAALEDRQLVVLPRRSAGRLSPGQLERLDRAVAAGLDVLVEAPDSTLCQHFGLELAAVERRALLPWPRPAVPASDLLRAVRPADLAIGWTRFRYAPPPLSAEERPSVHLSLDGRPLGWVTRHGEGSWIVLAMDLAELATRLRQGAPDNRFELAAGEGRADPTAADLAASPDLAAADHAWLDAWVEGVFGGQLTEVPLPRLAAAPFGADGWLLASTRTGVEGPTVARFATADELSGAATGLLTTWPGSAPPAPGFAERIGIGPVRPFVRPVGPDRQLERLSAATGQTPVLNRNAGGHWSKDPDLPFAAILGAGLRIDCSLGASAGESGWLFGSGVPFRPLATDGLAFALHEVVVHAERPVADADERRLERWLRYNAEGGAGPLHVLAEGEELIRLDRLAARRGHLRARPDELVRWWQRRGAVVLRSVQTPDGVEIRIANPGDEGFAVLVPLRWRDRSLAGWEADWGVAPSRRVQRFDRAYRLIELDGRADGGTLRLRYP